MAKIKNLIGEKFGKLTVLSLNERVGNKRQLYWNCICECGKLCVRNGENLKSGYVKSCGCIKKGNIKHGLCKKHPLYRVWCAMKERCVNINNHKYKNYGGRGIKVCDEWKNNFMDFYNWAMNNGYKHGLTIDRINNNGNYEPNNCRWITMYEQSINKTNTVFVNYKSKQYALIELCKIKNINYLCVKQRIKKLKWNIEKAIETPIRKFKNK